MATKTKKDYEEEARLKNWATSTPTYTGWNGGSVKGEDMMQATSDANKYGYDVYLDPRNKDTRDAIGSLLLDVDTKANADAVAGNGTYETNRQNYLDQIGWTDYQSVFKNLQDTGSLGLKDLQGNDLSESLITQRNGMLPGTPYELDPAELEAMQQAFAQQKAQEEYIQSHLSPLMNGQVGGASGGAWGYNEEDDPVWNAYLKQYSRAAEKGMNDALAQLSSRTGGLASSYAGQVAQQTYADQMQGATDMIPALYDAAYGRYMDEQQMAIDAEERAYARQQDALDRQQAAEQTAWERQAYADELAYNREQDALDRQFNQDQFDWEQTKYWNNLAKGSGGGSTTAMKYADFVELVASGYKPTQEEMDKYGLNKNMVQTIYNNANKGGEYDVNKILPDILKAETADDVAKLIDAAVNFNGMDEALAETLWEMYGKPLEDGYEDDEEESVLKRLLGIFR